MVFRKILICFICSFLGFILEGCTSPVGPASEYIQSLSEPPVFRGVYVTTKNHPDGTGEIIGVPSYPKGKFSVFPNPYPESIENPMNKHETFVSFNHLPIRVTFKIVRARSQASYASAMPVGMSAFDSHVDLVRTMEKNDVTQFWRWDLCDDKGRDISPGYYRVYFFGEGIPKNTYVDVQVNSIVHYLDRF